jgi:hypothetical protein
VTSNRRALTIYGHGAVSIGNNPGSNATLNVGKHSDYSSTAYFAADQPSAFNFGPDEHTYIRADEFLKPIGFNMDISNSKVVMGAGNNHVGINWTVPVVPLEIHQVTFGIGINRVGTQQNWLITADVQGPLRLNLRNQLQWDQLMTLTSKGSFYHITGNYQSLSDKNAKTSIEGLGPTLGKIMELKPRQYEMIHDNPAKQLSYGLVAQEVAQFLPEIVMVLPQAKINGQDIEKIHALNYSGLAPFLVKALQEQAHLLLELQQKMIALSGQ